MSEVGEEQAGLTAGAMLREARMAQGMHIAALAAAIKVTPRKLEALEADRYEELSDTTFTRALAQAVCRALKIPAEPVLAKLPQAPGKGLEKVSEGINAPFRERGSRRDSSDWPAFNRPVVWGSAMLVAAAVAVYFLPPGWLNLPRGAAPAEAPAASAVADAASTTAIAAPAPMPTLAAPVAVPASASTAAPTVAASAAASAPTAAPALVPAASTVASRSPVVASPASMALPLTPPPTAPGAGNTAEPQLTVKATSGPSWLEVQDATGKVLISRTVQTGESVSLAGPVPLRVKIGNAAVTQLSFRGQPVPLSTRDNVARLELK
ncbi:helix-turn-helix domain-containing protein [Ideonella sp. BN130291]|uniref:helix-turn-helix domain-containing protein n=1 Tax=Ideonella sp. BN130291 TaxID=3112940 RepID=UPI002E253640|nr:helix-turn-helix domain-containing protein [Ideonella sp. BN130291]